MDGCSYHLLSRLHPPGIKVLRESRRKDKECLNSKWREIIQEEKGDGDKQAMHRRINKPMKASTSLLIREIQIKIACDNISYSPTKILSHETVLVRIRSVCRGATVLADKLTVQKLKIQLTLELHDLNCQSSLICWYCSIVNTTVIHGWILTPSCSQVNFIHNQDPTNRGMCTLCVPSLSHVWLFGTSWTVTHQSPLSMEFSRQESWSG